MTPDEIMSMTPDQLREEIAQRKGYEKRGAVKLSNGDFMPIYSAPTGKTTHTLPDWTHDIGAADELVNEMVNAPGVVNVQTESKIYGQYSECYFREYPSSDADLITGHGETRPLAISRAWVIWDEGRKSRL